MRLCRSAGHGLEEAATHQGQRGENLQPAAAAGFVCIFVAYLALMPCHTAQTDDADDVDDTQPPFVHRVIQPDEAFHVGDALQELLMVLVGNEA